MPSEEHSEDRYTAIQFMFKNTEHHNVDTVMELLDEWLPCDHPEYPPTPTDPEHEDACNCQLHDGWHIHNYSENPCYMRSLSGCSGTEEQCWKNLGIHESVAEVKTADLKLILSTLNRVHKSWGNESEEVRDAFTRLLKEAYWWDEV